MAKSDEQTTDTPDGAATTPDRAAGLNGATAAPPPTPPTPPTPAQDPAADTGGSGHQPPRRRGLSRRQFLPRAAGALVALGAGGVGGYELHDQTTPVVKNPYAKLATADQGTNARLGPAPGTPGSGMHRFVTRPDLLPPRLNLTELRPDGAVQTRPRFIVIAPMSNVQYEGLQRGPMMLDRRGRLVWFHPITASIFDVNVQHYNGKPRLTWWQGRTVDGHGIGTAMFVDHHYQTVATVGSRPGAPIDLHEFNMTPEGTALLSSYQVTTADLTAVGGPVKGRVLAGHALEVDVRSGKILLDWNSLDHVGVEESYETLNPAKDYDYFHINSIAVDSDGNLLISGRHTWTIYKVDRHTGKVIWRLNGKRSDFNVAPNARFSWQHHVRPHAKGTLTIFDNASANAFKPTLSSRALHLRLETRRRRASLVRAYQHPAKFTSAALGSVQILPDGHFFVGWGQQPYFSEFAADGRMLMTAQFDAQMRSYRTFAVNWVGYPPGRPAVVATKSPIGGFVVYASWNGATEIDHWDVLAGSDPHALKQIASQPWCDFETAIAVNSQGPLFAVVAVDRNGVELGRSKVV